MLNYLVPTDGSDLSLDAVRHVIRLSQEGLPVQVTLAHVREPVHLYEMVLAPDVDVLENAGQAAAEHALIPAATLLKEAGLAWTETISLGDPASVLAELALECGCDGIVISTGGAGLLSNGRIGRVADAVLHHAEIPVTVVRRFEGEGAEG